MSNYIVPEERNKREKLKNDIDIAVENTNNFEEFLAFMQAKQYEIKRGKYLYFKGEYGEVFLNTKLLGSAYTEKSIRKRIANHTPVKNHKVHIYDDKLVKMSYRKRLKYAIDDSLKIAKDYDEYIRLMRERDYEIKFGKHLAFKHITAERFIRCENLGAAYTEDMLKLYFTDRESYDSIKKNVIDRLVTPNRLCSNKYAEIQNINIQIRMLNYLRENNIKSYDELAAIIERYQRKVDINNNNIETLNTQIAEKKEMIKSLRAYWQYKPYMTDLYKCRTEEEKAKYRADKAVQLDRFERAVKVINSSKKADGTLPKATDINLEIEQQEKLKNQISEKNLKDKSELGKYIAIEENLKIILSDKKINKSVEEKTQAKKENYL